MDYHFLFLVALNGGLVLGLMYLRDFTVKGVPVIFIVAPVIFIIELIVFISCLFGGTASDEYDAADDGEPAEAVEEPVPVWNRMMILILKTGKVLISEKLSEVWVPA